MRNMSVSFLLTPNTDCKDLVMERGDNGAAYIQKEEEVVDGGSGRRKKGEKRKAFKTVTARQPNSFGSRKGSQPVLEGQRRSCTSSKALPINPFNKPPVENLVKSNKSFLRVVTNFSLCLYKNECIYSIVSLFLSHWIFRAGKSIHSFPTAFIRQRSTSMQTL